MTSFLKDTKIEICSCNAMFSFLKVTKFCISKNQKLTKKDHDQQLPEISDCVVTIYLFHSFYHLLGTNWELLTTFLWTKFITKQFFCSVLGIILISTYIIWFNLQDFKFLMLNSQRYRCISVFCPVFQIVQAN